MKIRSITCFFDPRARGAQQAIDRIGKLRQAAVDQFSKSGFEVQTTRLATVPFPIPVPHREDIESAVRLAQRWKRMRRSAV